jgi:Cu/Ag efflux protein CusF
MRWLFISILVAWLISVSGVGSFALINQHESAIPDQSAKPLHGIAIAEKEISGQVSEIKNGNRLIIKDETGKTKSFKVTNPLILEQIKVGDKVKVTIENGGAASIQKAE